MIDRRAVTFLLVVVVVVLASSAFPSANAFMALPSPSVCRSVVLRTDTTVYDHTTEKWNVDEMHHQQQEQQQGKGEDVIASAIDDKDTTTSPSHKLIMDIPPMPSSTVGLVDAATSSTSSSVSSPPDKTTKPKKKAGGGNPHKEGVFSPIVIAAGVILGEEQLNKIRGQAIALHSDLIKSFVDTSDSALGQAVLRQLFTLIDTDGSGYLDKKEVAQALNLLGFKWLGDSQVDKIFERADADGDKTISLEEFMTEAPKTLRTNLVKLAKSNGGEMGLLV